MRIVVALVFFALGVILGVGVAPVAGITLSGVVLSEVEGGGFPVAASTNSG